MNAYLRRWRKPLPNKMHRCRVGLADEPATDLAARIYQRILGAQQKKFLVGITDDQVVYMVSDRFDIGYEWFLNQPRLVLGIYTRTLDVHALAADIMQHLEDGDGICG